jgi:hypothetical protein
VPARIEERIYKIRGYISAHPESSIPEMRLLKDDDWVFAVRDIRLDTEASVQKALAQVRMAAQSRLGGIAAAAVRDYMDANDGQVPSDVTQLAPYLADSTNADLLQGLEKASPTAPPGCLFQGVSGADDWYGSICYVADDHYTATGSGPGLAIEEAVNAFQHATGNLPNDPSQIIPYLEASVSPATVNAIFAGLRSSPNSPPVTSQYGGMCSFSGSGSTP